MTRPDASEEPMLSAMKRYGLTVVLVLGALLLTHFINPDTLLAQFFFPAISRSIIEPDGGRLWARAKNGPGAIFHFRLPRYHEEESNA